MSRKFRTRPEVGSALECAIWLDGKETAEQRRQFEADVRTSMTESMRQQGCVPGPLTFTERRPGEARVPPVPDHIAGPDVRLLVAECIVASHKIDVRREAGFCHDLEPADLATLRRITRRKYAEQYPALVKKNGHLTDRQCETLINDLGPETALATLRGARREHLH